MLVGIRFLCLLIGVGATAALLKSGFYVPPHQLPLAGGLSFRAVVGNVVAKAFVVFDHDPVF